MNSILCAGRAMAATTASALVLGGCGVAPAGSAPASSPAAGSVGLAVSPTPSPGQGPGWGIVIHGGAGTIERGSLSPEREQEYHAALEESLRAGHAILERGGDALDAVAAAVHVLEDSPLFNAGRGAVFTADGRNELDAAVMYGPTREAGAVAGITRVRNPIDLARLVMEQSPHVMMIGTGAETFGEQHGIEMVDPSYFHTESRWRSLERAREAERQRSGIESDLRIEPGEEAAWKMGTVGAVALDRDGNLAAGTSTGGMTNKRWGRVGDVPIIGAGTYADNDCGGISATGHGEYFIRAVVAYDICAITTYRGVSLQDAAHHVVMEKLVEFGGEGGIVALDRWGNPTMTFNSAGMYRGYMSGDGEITTAIYRD